MTAAERHFAREVGWGTLGLVVVFAVVLGLFELAEAAGLALRWSERLRAAVSVLPAWGGAVLPVAAALAAARTVAAWRDDARWVAVHAAGLRPERLGVAAMIGVALAAGVVAVAREAVSASVRDAGAVRDAWALLDAPVPPEVDRGWFGAEVLLPDRAIGVRVAWLRDGVVVGRWSAPAASWHDGWVVAGDAVLWHADGAWTVPADLPEPERWRRAATPPSWDVPVRVLWQAPPSRARTAWLVERLATPVLAVWVAGVVVLVGPRRWLLGGAGIAAVALRLVAVALFSAAAVGQVGVWVAAVVPLVACGVAFGWAAAASRRL